MRSVSYIFFLTILMLLNTACQKKKNAAPVINTVPKDSTVIVYPDSAHVLYTQPLVPPYTDTFYGEAQESDDDYLNANTTAYIFVYHPTTDSIAFSSNYFVNGPPNNVNFGGFDQGYSSWAINAANYYSWSFNFKVFYNFKIVNDSLYYNSSQLGGSEAYEGYFAGKKISR